MQATQTDSFTLFAIHFSPKDVTYKVEEADFVG
jgi:hypothetical protein